MRQNDITTKLASRAGGQFVRVITERPAKVKKSSQLAITKRSVMSLQLAAYGNRKPVREAVANEEREAPSLPKWVARVEKQGPITFWHGHNGQVYLALPLAQSHGSSFLVNGEAVSLDEIKEHLLASEKVQRASKEETEEKGQAQFVAIKLENIKEIE